MNELAGGIDRPSIQPMRGTEGSPIIGPTNPAREAQNLDRLAPPKTDPGLSQPEMVVCRLPFVGVYEIHSVAGPNTKPNCEGLKDKET